MNDFICILEHEGVTTFYPEEMSREEALEHTKEQLQIRPKSRLQTVHITIDEETGEVLIKPTYDSVRRTRRITGYLSNVDNFNDAKKAEADARYRHFDDNYGEGNVQNSRD